MGTLIQDFKYGLRMLAKNPGFTAIAVLTLALGIGGNSAMFSIVNSALIQPLPYPDSARLVQAANSGYYPPGGLVDLQQESRTMEVAGFQSGVELNLTGQGQALRLSGSAVSANLFTVLGKGAELGSTFKPGEDQPGRGNIVILSDALWKNEFAGDPQIVGRVIPLGGVDRQIIGVMPSSFEFPDPMTEFWIPLDLDPRDPTAYWALNFMPIIARLRPGATLEQAQGEIKSLSHQMIKLFPYPMGTNWNAEATVIPLQQYMVMDIRAKLILLQCALALVLLIACANVANLLLSRAATRQKEIALRAALGAVRRRIVRQLLTESVVLGLAGGGLGLALASLAPSMLEVLLPPEMRGRSYLTIDWHVLLFTGGLAILAGLAFGLIPALGSSKVNLTESLKSAGRQSTGTLGVRVRGALIAAEVALAVVLTVGAGLLIKSLWRLAQVNPGFQPQQIITLRISPDQSLCRGREACIAFYSELERRTRGLAGVSDVALANTLPLARAFPFTAVQVEGLPYVPAEHTSPLFWAGAVSPGYFRLMQIPILQGRGFDESDGEKSPLAVIVSAATARKYWPGQDPIGKHLKAVREDQWRTVVGVAADVRLFDLAGHSPDYINGVFYMPYAQSVDNEMQLPASMRLIIRTGAHPAEVAGQVQGLVADLNPNVPVGEMRTMTAVVSDSTSQSRSLMWLFLSFAGMALLLAAVGTYGVISHVTSQRTFELGIRVALGATQGNIFGLVVGQTFRIVLAGIALGVVASLALTRFLAAFLYGTGPADPLTLVLVCALLVVIGLIAGFIPARRAMKVDPIVALRYE